METGKWIEEKWEYNGRIYDKMPEKTCLEEKWEYDNRWRDWKMTCTLSREHTGVHSFEYSGESIRH